MDKLFYYIFIGKIICFLVVSGPLLAQDSYPLQWQCSEADKAVLVQEKLWDIEVDSLNFNRIVEAAMHHMRSGGYLLARIKTINYSQASIVIGERYEWANLSAGNVPDELLQASGFKDKLYRHKPFNYRQTARMLKNIVATSEQRGYPFAAVKLDSVSIDGSNIAAILDYKAGPVIIYDTIDVSGTAKINSVFLASYLKIKPGWPYDQKEIEQVAGKLEQLNYARLTSPLAISFANSEVEVQMRLDHVKSNHIDGVIGFLPGENEDNKLLITGQLDLELNNPFGKGKSLKMNWQAIKPLSQTFDVRYYHPAVLKGPLSLIAGLNLLKEDTTFFNREFSIGAEMNISVPWRASLFASYKKGSLLSTTIYEGATELPDLLDYEVKEYGLTLNYSKLNNIHNPTNGISGNIGTSIGTKVITKNPGIEEILYNDVDLNTTVYRLEAAIRKYTTLSGQWVVFNELRTAHLFNSSILLNELYRIGGLASLRGFNQNEFFAAQYAVLVNELRLYFESSSYLFAFYDQGILHFDLNQTSLDDEPLGFGMGISMNTGSGVFNFAYALGKSKSQPVSFNLSKIHFGYVAKF